ncbi:TPA: hypothetical protein QDB13_002330 [Burkholderia vietnamiensis]|nr:hypothetical protein [Burkholderia vietnamiensis]HDR9032671.1 hypothetical protein [Burkholderia vietnamiensis]HDR9157692.1 hypothetical protein [Burkholderia vietnamiensis]
MNLYFDNNVLSDLIRAGVNPVVAVADSEFVLSATPDLAEEYRQAIESERVPLAEKELCRALLVAATPRGIFGFAEAGAAYSGFGHGMWATKEMVETIRSTKITPRPGKVIPKNRTDAFLAALSQGAVVVTNDTGGHYKRAKAAGQHVYTWPEIYDVEKAPSDIARKLSSLLSFP